MLLAGAPGRPSLQRNRRPHPLCELRHVSSPGTGGAVLTHDLCRTRRRRASLIAEVTESRYMPPWHAAHGYGDFAGERRLTEAQIATLAEWVKQGMPRGRPGARCPRCRSFRKAGTSARRDLVLKMPAAYELPASGPDIYRNFVVPAQPDGKQVGPRHRIPSRRAEGRTSRALRLRCRRRGGETGRQGRQVRGSAAWGRPGSQAAGGTGARRMGRRSDAGFFAARAWRCRCRRDRTSSCRCTST